MGNHHILHCDCPVFLICFIIDQPPLVSREFCISVSGYRLNDPFCLEFLVPGYSTPTLHILGKTDIVVVEERSRQLIEVSENPRVEEHNGGDSYLLVPSNVVADLWLGHFVPSQSAWRKFFANYMNDPSGQHPSPNASVLVNSEPGAEIRSHQVSFTKLL
jgi:Serine hydrolase (FSH1)